jgi:hypothetical protein
MVVILSPSFEAVCFGRLKNLRNLEMNLQINAIKKLLEDHSFKLNRKITSHFRRKGLPSRELLIFLVHGLCFLYQ